MSGSLKSEYVSFGHVVKATRTNVRTDTYSSISEPTFEKEISLFPLLDKFILYTPSYVIRNRNKKIHIPMLIFVVLMFIIRACNHVIYFVSVQTEHSDSVQNLYNDTFETQVFLALMFLLPWVNNIIRLHYFLKYFNFKLWHYPSYINPKSGIKTINNQILNKLSHLLREPAYTKSTIGKRFRIGWFLIMLIILTQMVFRVIATHLYSKSVIMFFELDRMVIWTYGIIWSVLYAFVFDIPDLLYLLIARIHFIESQLYITHFTQELISMSLDEVIESNLFHKYLMMQKDIKKYVQKFYYFTVVMSLQILCGVWYGVNYVFSIRTWSNASNAEHISLYTLFWMVSTLVIALQLMFALNPAVKMTELNNILLQNVNHKIDDIMANRQRFHDEILLNDFMDIVCKKSKYISYNRNLSPYKKMKFNDKTMELKDKIGKYSIQKESLIILNQLLYAIEQKPCSYRLIGITVDKYLMKHILIIVILCQIFSIMWKAV